MFPEPQYFQEIAKEYNYSAQQVQSVLEMIHEWDSVPFIARYRKERTRNLDEEAIRQIVASKTSRVNLYKAKITALTGIDEQGLLTDELQKKIITCQTLKEVEEIYKPYRLKKKTKAMLAIEKWFQAVVDVIKSWKLESELWKLFPKIYEAYSQEEILEWCLHIISAEISSEPELRSFLKKQLYRNSRISAKQKWEKALEKLNEKDTKQIPKFALYEDFSLWLRSIKPYQILALNRWESLWILRVKIEKIESIEEDTRYEYLKSLGYRGKVSEILEQACTHGYGVLFKSLENEIRGELSEMGEDDAIESFRSNLDALLMTRPEYGKRILAVDPWFKAGCKIVLLDEGGNPLEFDKIFLFQKAQAQELLKKYIKKYTPQVIVLGNGTGASETLELLQEITQIEVYIVNESGASVYSASSIAQEEFPDLDALDRGTVSIGRRFIDPLSELVKVPVESIGVGMYQHDIPVKKLEENLGYTVEDVVNRVGINVNTASSHVLNHIAGIDKRTAKKIFQNRPYMSREELKKILSEKVYQQAIWFLRIPTSKEHLDNTDIHPEQYALARYYLACKGEGNVREIFSAREEELQKLYPEANTGTLDFIDQAYREIGQEKRTLSTHQKAQEKIDPNSITEGSVVQGIIRNVVAFGAFVDIGLKNDGLVHISQIADRFISHPSKELEVWQKIRVKVMSLDNGKIQLSMKEVSEK